jgi:hypothetical protein
MDEDARALLERVQEIKREMTSTADCSFPCGGGHAAEGVLAGPCGGGHHTSVLSPGHVSVTNVLTMQRGCGGAAASAAADGASSPSPSPSTMMPMVLMPLNWTARANSCLDANLKLILAYCAVLL